MCETPCTVYIYIANDIVQCFSITTEHVSFVLGKLDVIFRDTIVKLEGDKCLNFCWYMKRLVHPKTKCTYVRDELYEQIRKEYINETLVTFDIIVFCDVESIPYESEEQDNEN